MFFKHLWDALTTSPSAAWHYGMEDDMAVDFALWLLEENGLHAPPFDAHETNQPNTLGLTAEAWTACIKALATASVTRKAEINTTRGQNLSRPTYLLNPEAFYPDEMRVDAIRAQYTIYQKTALHRRREFGRVVMDAQSSRPRDLREDWQIMSDARGELAPVFFFIAPYTTDIVYPVAATGVILTFATIPTVANMRRAKLDGLAALNAT